MIGGSIIEKVLQIWGNCHSCPLPKMSSWNCEQNRSTFSQIPHKTKKLANHAEAHQVSLLSFQFEVERKQKDDLDYCPIYPDHILEHLHPPEFTKGQELGQKLKKRSSLNQCLLGQKLMTKVVRRPLRAVTPIQRWWG